MALIDKVNKPKKTVKKQSIDASLNLKEAHLEWLLQMINDGNIKGKELQTAVETVQWLQQEYKRLQINVKGK